MAFMACYNSNALAQNGKTTNSKMVFSGQVIDAASKESLPFVNIVFEGHQRFGTTTDIDGYFSFTGKNDIQTITFSYIGYVPKTLKVSDIKDLKKIQVRLKSDVYKIPVVDVLSTENPAHRIIKKAVKNRKKNRPEANKSYRYNSYNKMFFTYDVWVCSQEDTINASDIQFGETLSRSDSSLLAMRQLKDSTYLFLTESITEKVYKKPGKEHETILASRVSGFKTPLFSVIGTQIQSFSIYRDYFNLGGNNFLSPISRNSHHKYIFILKDTIITPKLDTCFNIAFLPKRNKNFDGLKGSLLINTRGYAVQNFIAEPVKEESGIKITIRQKYELLQDSIWFPAQLDADITLNINGMVDDEVENASLEENTKKMDILGRAKSYIRNVRLNEKVKNKEFSHVLVDYEPDYAEKDSTFWATYRTDTLSKKEKTTYVLIDSLGEKIGLENKFKWLHYLLTGKIGLGYIDIDLNRIMSYNRATGFALGLGLNTSYKLCKSNQLSGYFSYGFKDKHWKYGLAYKLNIRDHYDSNFKLEYFNDLMEIGEIQFLENKSNALINTQDIRPFMRKYMYYQKMFRPSLEWRFMYYLKAKLWTSYSDVYRLTEPYYFVDPIDKEHQYLLEAGLQLKYAFREKYIQTPFGYEALRTKYPVLFLNYSQSLESPWEELSTSSFSYKKLWGKIEKGFQIKDIGISTFSLWGGKAWGDIPYYKLYHGRGRYMGFGIESVQSFATMRFNEFIANEFVYLFYRHQFGSLLFKKGDFAPEFSIVHNMGWSKLNMKYFNNSLDFKDMHKGYFESGIVIDNLFTSGFSSYGISVSYRYGAYSFKKVIDNFAFGMSLKTSF